MKPVSGERSRAIPKVKAVAWLLLPLLALAVALRADEPYAPSRDYDLQNARVHLRVDPGEQKITGEVTHTLAPIRDNLERLEFDSVNLTISSVTVAGKPAKFETTATKLLVTLDRPARAGQQLKVTIRYEGKPKLQGMRFILPDSNYPHRGPQIWTQGEAEDTRYYIPIYDYPNDLTTTEMIATVPKSWITLSNGKLLSVKDEADGTRTWNWRQSQPHAVYLISLVAGEFDEVKQSWRNIPVTYYVPCGERERIAPTFSRTPKMLEFFSERFGVPYPWDKYAQIAVDEHFGGMEHTSATTLTATSTIHPALVGETSQGSDDLISHELAHQWFGDLVTCKDWANLWINEGFASFAEHLWEEHEYGADAAAYSRWQSRNNWFQAERLYPVPIVTRDFTSANQYSGNVYGKASLVLHMLHRQLGDEDFFRGVRHFLTKHAHRNVVAADLVKAIEEATGRNTDAFFDQWIYGAGAPRFEVRYEYQEKANQLELEVKQTQKVEGRVGLFRVPVEIEVTTLAGKKTFPITVSKASETFTFPLEDRPLLVLFDEGSHILKSLEFKKSWQEWIYQLEHAEEVPDRADAAQALREVKDNDEVVAALGKAARDDAYWGVRIQALRALGSIGGPAAQNEIATALANPQPWVRQVVVEAMGGFKDDASVEDKLEEIYRNDKAYRVRVAALRSLAQLKSANAFDLLMAAANTDSPDDRLRSGALRAMGTLEDDKAVPLLVEWAAPGKTFSVRSAAIGSLGQLDKKNKEITQKLAAYAGEPYLAVRFSALSALSQRGDPEAIAPLETLLASGEFEGFAERFVRGIVTRLKQQKQVAEQLAGGGAEGAPQAQGQPSPPAGRGAAAVEELGRKILEKLDQLEREIAELKERLKKLEEN